MTSDPILELREVHRAPGPRPTRSRSSCRGPSWRCWWRVPVVAMLGAGLLTRSRLPVERHPT